MLVWAALQTGISPDPQAVSAYTSDRKVYTAEGGYYYFGGAMRSYLLAQVPWLQNRARGFKIVADHEVNVHAVGSNGVIDTIVANGISMARPTNPSQLDLRTMSIPLDSKVATWQSGDRQWTVDLIVQSDKPGHARVCWNVHLPPPPPLESDDPTYVPFVRTAPLKRIMCGIYSARQIGPDVGGQVIDDRGSAEETSTMRAEW